MTDEEIYADMRAVAEANWRNSPRYKKTKCLETLQRIYKELNAAYEEAEQVHDGFVAVRQSIVQAQSPLSFAIGYIEEMLQ